MSYILDALKKSDQERQRHTAPGINTAHTDMGRERKGRSLWPCLLVAALSLNAALLLWWLQPWQSTKQTAQTEQQAGQGTAATEETAAKETREETAEGTERSEGTERTVKEHEAIRMADLATPQPSAPRQAERSAVISPAHRGPVGEPPLPAEAAVSEPADAPSATSSAQATSAGRKTEGLTEGPPVNSREAPKKERKPDSAESVESKESKESKKGTESALDKARIKPDMKKASNPLAAKSKSANQEESTLPVAVNKGAQKPAKESPTSSSGSRSAAAQAVADSPRRQQESVPANAMGQEEEKVKPMTAAVKPAPPTDRQDAPLVDVHPPARPSARIEEDLEPLMDNAGEKGKGDPELGGLPPDVRRDLPGLSISMLVYARNPADRMVGVNGRVLREGQQVEPDLKLLEITPKGAVFSFRGHRFYKPVL